MNKRKKPQRSGIFSIEEDEYIDLVLPPKRGVGRKYYPMSVQSISMREVEYIEINMELATRSSDSVTILIGDDRESFEAEEE